MTVQAVNYTHTVPLTQVIRAKYSNSPIAVPVERDALLYARFKHVRGLPAGPEGGGVPLSKLQALDNLIERLGRIGGDGRKGASAGTAAGGRDAAGSLIQEYSRMIHDTLKQDRLYGTAGSGLLDSGIVVNQLV